ncbi:hypothetical protein VTK26DRAFT_8390 [Humicola hyalothermophila]
MPSNNRLPSCALVGDIAVKPDRWLRHSPQPFENRDIGFQPAAQTVLRRLFLLATNGSIPTPRHHLSTFLAIRRHVRLVSLKIRSPPMLRPPGMG